MLIHFPKEYGNVVPADDESHATFQKHKDIQSMRDCIVNALLGKTATKFSTLPKRNLIGQFDLPLKGHTSNYGEEPQKSTWNSRWHDLLCKQLKYNSEPTTPPLKQSRQRSTATHTSSESSAGEKTLSQTIRPVEMKQTAKKKTKQKRYPLELLAQDEPIEKKKSKK